MTSLASVIQFLIYCKRSSSRPLQLHFTTSLNILCMLFIRLSAITAQAIPTCVTILPICGFGTALNSPPVTLYPVKKKKQKKAPKPAAWCILTEECSSYPTTGVLQKGQLLQTERLGFKSWCLQFTWLNLLNWKCKSDCSLLLQKN